MITLTELAAEKIKDHIEHRGKGRGIRIGVQTTGCSGYAYLLEFFDLVERSDVVYRDKGIDIAVDKKWSNMLWGVTVDYKHEGLNEGFDFVNPNETARCGCGESFTV